MSLTTTQASAAAARSFANGSDIVSFFQSQTSSDYIDWFNANCARKVSWSGKALGSTDAVKDSFVKIWDNIPHIFGSSSINLLQFAALMSILTNEVGAELQPVSELCGHMGLAYPFNAIEKVKVSYNSSPNNKLAGELFFDDELFWNTHRTLACGSSVRAREDLKAAWNGTVYPAELPGSLVPGETAFIQQADFYKFRGRGFIQMTWRSNYKGVVNFVQQYDGDQPVILKYKSDWEGKDADAVCTMSTDEDWDALFQQTDLVVPCRAVGLHNEASSHDVKSRYLTLADVAPTLTTMSDIPGSFFRMGHRISGGVTYATLFSNRVVQVLTTLNYQG